MSPEDVRIFGPRPKLSQSMSNAEDLQGRGDHHLYISISLRFPGKASDIDASGEEDELYNFKDDNPFR